MRKATVPPSIKRELRESPPPVYVHSHENLRDKAMELQRALLRKDEEGVYFTAREFNLEIAAHIADEDSPDGLYGQIEQTSPQMGYVLKRLRAQHDMIRRTLRIIISEMDDDLVSVEGLIGDCLNLVKQHEREEERLIEDVFFRDEATGY